MIRVIHPRPALGRQKFIGVEFVDGVAVVESLHPEVEAALFLHGFAIEDELEVPADAVAPFEPLPPADGTEKVSKPLSKSQRKRLAEQADFAETHIVPLSADEE